MAESGGGVSEGPFIPARRLARYQIVKHLFQSLRTNATGFAP